MARADIRDVAREAGVSIGTVSNVLNRPHLVADETRVRVQAVIDRTGFVRNAAARHLRQGQSRTIGLVVHDITNPFFAEIARTAADAATERDYLLFLCHSGGSTDKEAAFLRALAEQQVRGVLLTPLTEAFSTTDSARSVANENGQPPAALVSPAQALTDQRIPLVLVDRPSDRTDRCSVTVDDRHGADLAATHLIETGRTRLAYVRGPSAINQYVDRRAGIHRALNRAGLPIETHLKEISVPDPLTSHTAEAARQLLAADRLPDGVLCGNDVLAIGLMRDLLTAGVRIPDDVAIVGYDDIDFAITAPVPLSSVRQPTSQMSRLATELLLGECDQPKDHIHQQVVLKPELFVRESSARR